MDKNSMELFSRIRGKCVFLPSFPYTLMFNGYAKATYPSGQNTFIIHILKKWKAESNFCYHFCLIAFYFPLNRLHLPMERDPSFFVEQNWIVHLSWNWILFNWHWRNVTYCYDSLNEARHWSWLLLLNISCARVSGYIKRVRCFCGRPFFWQCFCGTSCCREREKSIEKTAPVVAAAE